MSINTIMKNEYRTIPAVGRVEVKSVMPPPQDDRNSILRWDTVVGKDGEFVTPDGTKYGIAVLACADPVVFVSQDGKHRWTDNDVNLATLVIYAQAPTIVKDLVKKALSEQELASTAVTLWRP